MAETERDLTTLQGVLVVGLAFQNAGSGLLMRYVRATPEE